MSDIEQLTLIMQAFSIVSVMDDFIGKDDVEKYLRWAAKNYSERIYKQSNKEN